VGSQRSYGLQQLGSSFGATTGSPSLAQLAASLQGHAGGGGGGREQGSGAGEAGGMSLSEALGLVLQHQQQQQQQQQHGSAAAALAAEVTRHQQQQQHLGGLDLAHLSDSQQLLLAVQGAGGHAGLSAALDGPRGLAGGERGKMDAWMGGGRGGGVGPGGAVGSGSLSLLAGGHGGGSVLMHFKDADLLSSLRAELQTGRPGASWPGAGEQAAAVCKWLGCVSGCWGGRLRSQGS
jgi:hypothetical protein